LKLYDRAHLRLPALSPPARGRGLKHIRKEHPMSTAIVAPRAGAWIETRMAP